ncbi:MAG: hypothetical protein V7K94_08755 [Nostoc sp.]|uniref:hypothetical protein n=1 Tax=Nostoc sp. TaxID=1180 RepID=UPI002FFAF8D7
MSNLYHVLMGDAFSTRCSAEGRLHLHIVAGEWRSLFLSQVETRRKRAIANCRGKN